MAGYIDARPLGPEITKAFNEFRSSRHWSSLEKHVATVELFVAMLAHMQEQDARIAALTKEAP